MHKYFFIFWIFLACQFRVTGQEFNFTQFNATPTRVNPSWVCSDNNFSTTAHYRNQNILGSPWSSSLITIVAPLKVRNKINKIGFGASILDDRYINDQEYIYQNFNTSLAYNVQISKLSFLSAGMQVGYTFNQIKSISGSTGSQYDIRNGFDAGISTNENSYNNSNSFFCLGGGIQYVKKDTLGRKKLLFGMAILNATQYTYGKLDQNSGSNYSPTMFFHTRYTFALNNHQFLSPDFLIFKYNQNTIYSLGLTGTVNFNGLNNKKNFFDLTARTNVQKSFAVIGKLTIPSFSIGCSYEMPYENSYQKVSGNITEVLVSYYLPIKGKNESIKKKKKIVKLKKNVKKKTKKKVIKKKIVKNKSKRKKNKVVKAKIVKQPVKTIVIKKIEKLDPIKTYHSPVRLRSELDLDSLLSYVSNIAVDTTLGIINIKKDTILGESSKMDSTVVEGKDVNYLQEISDTEALKKGKVLSEIIKNNLQFEVNSVSILPSSFILLDEMAEILNKNTRLKLFIIGHTDNVGLKEKNQVLSLKRAEAIKQYLISKGVIAEKISTRGMGDIQPLYPNNTSANKSKNRRVEFMMHR